MSHLGKKQYRVLEYNNLCCGIIHLSYKGDVRVSYDRYGGKNYRNKYACFSIKEPYSSAPIDIKDECTSIIFPDFGDKLFVSHEVRTSRDLIRNSGYKIVRDPDSADSIIVPQLFDHNASYLKYDVVVFNQQLKCLYLYTIKHYTYNPAPDENLMDKIRHYFNQDNNSQYEFFHDSPVANGIMWFIPKCPVYKEILEEQFPKRGYVFENNIKKLYPVEFNIEALETWRRCDDSDLVVKSICNSNWEDYPVTLLAFLKNDMDYWFVDNPNNQFKLVLDTIGWERKKNFYNSVIGREIQPKDWNMLQSYIMYRLGVGEKGGYTKVSGVRDYLSMIRSCKVVAPRLISSPQIYENIVGSC